MDLICPFCKINYDLFERVPLLFTTCGHSFCYSCILNIIETSDQTPRCPEDGEKLENYDENKGMSNFPVNRAIT